MRLVPLVSTMLALSVPGSVAAQTLDDGSASGGMTITVIIAPIAPILAAHDNGAAGIWSMTGGSSGLMIKLDSSVQPGSEGALQLYTPVNGAEYRVSVANGSLGQISELGRSQDRGLNRHNYAVKSLEVGDARPMTLLIASL